MSFLFILLIIRLLLFDLYYKIHLWSSAFPYAGGLSAFDEIGSYYQQSDNFFIENQLKKHFLSSFSVLNFRSTKRTKFYTSYLSSKFTV